MKETLVLAVIAAIGVGVIAVTVWLAVDCSDRGGVLVRGYLWPACVAKA
jgi:hypothetical protein